LEGGDWDIGDDVWGDLFCVVGSGDEWAAGFGDSSGGERSIDGCGAGVDFDWELLHWVGVCGWGVADSIASFGERGADWGYCHIMASES
jgi:hypothetical protein